ncbi:MAG TPA: inositol monophosphatase family protein [Dongiaceae bacterium]|nr:inositol monophosphatase family protein [Dongiaceae bacterium]
MSDDTPAALRDFAVEIAREAGTILRGGWGHTHRPERKGRIDLVTEFDRRSEELLLRRVRERYPAHAILAEESGGSGATAGTRWLIDPLDGTTNFAHNYPFFCVSLGIEQDGRLVAGVVHDPVRDETFAAALGHGATLDGRPIHVSDVARLEDALLVTGFHYSIRERPEPTLTLFREFLLRAQGVRRDGSAALNLCYLACGRFDGFWEARLSAWDMAAGVLIVREAGGVVTDFTGGPFRLDGRQILTANAPLHDAMRELIAAVPGAAER